MEQHLTCDFLASKKKEHKLKEIVFEKYKTFQFRQYIERFLVVKKTVICNIWSTITPSLSTNFVISSQFLIKLFTKARKKVLLITNI